MLGTRPDIAYAVTKLASFSANPSKEHLNRALYIMRYLNYTRNYALVYDGKQGDGLIAYTDSDYAQDPNHRKSMTGNMTMLASCVITWKSYTQKTIATSSTEAEYMAMFDCGKQVAWIRNMLMELGYSLTTPTPLYADSHGAIFNASNPTQEKRTKHMDVRYHKIRKFVELMVISIFYIEGSENPADIFTKPLGRILFEKFRKELGLIFYPNA